MMSLIRKWRHIRSDYAGLGVLDVDAVTHSGKMLGLAIASLSSVNKHSSFVRGNGVYDYERIVSSIENFEKRYPDSDKQLADVRLTLDTFIDDNEDIAINVTSAYLQVLFNQELSKIAHNQIDLSKDQLKRIQAVCILNWRFRLARC